MFWAFVVFGVLMFLFRRSAAHILNNVFFRRKKKAMDDKFLVFHSKAFPGCDIRYVHRPGLNRHSALVFAVDSPHVLEHYLQNGVLDILSQNRSVLVFEPPGCGYSSVPVSFSHSVGEHVLLWSEFLDSINKEQQHVWISCIGCANAYVALSMDSRFFRAFVVQQTPSLEEEKRWMQRVDFYGTLQTPILGQILNFLGCRWLAKTWFSVSMQRGELQKEFASIADLHLQSGAMFPLASLFQAFGSLAANELRATSRPLLALWSAHDRSHRKTQRSSSQSLTANETAFRSEEMEAGHCGELDAPHKFAEAVERFLQSNSLWEITFELCMFDGEWEKRKHLDKSCNQKNMLILKRWNIKNVWYGDVEKLISGEME